MLRNIFRPCSDRTLYIVRGVSGSGKSSLAGQITRWNIAADNFPGLYSDGSYNIQLQQLSHQWCRAQVERWMQQRKSKVAVHNTFVKPKYCQEYLELAAQYGYAVQVICAEAVILPSGAHPGNIHNVPADVLERQQQNWQPYNNPGGLND